jgi:hypothetical protein
MNGNVILVGDDYEMLLQLAIGLHGTPDTVTVAESARPLARALQLVVHRPRAMLVTLDGTESVVDVRGLFRSRGLGSPRRQSAARAPLARVVKEHGGFPVTRDAPIVW